MNEPWRRALAEWLEWIPRFVLGFVLAGATLWILAWAIGRAIDVDSERQARSAQEAQADNQ